MSEVSTTGQEWHTGEAGLCALGVYLASLSFWEPFERLVHVPQKTVLYTPISKLKTLVCLFLAQGRHVVETNKRVRPDTALYTSFGCAPCEQSVLQDTLSAWRPSNRSDGTPAVCETGDRPAMHRRWDMQSGGRRCGTT